MLDEETSLEEIIAISRSLDRMALSLSTKKAFVISKAAKLLQELAYDRLYYKREVKRLRRNRKVV